MRYLGRCFVLSCLLGTNVSADDPLPQFIRDLEVLQ